MAEFETFRFHGDQYLEVEIFFGSPIKEGRILLHPDKRIRTSASCISQIFWEDPGAFKRLVGNLRDYGSMCALNPVKTRLVNGVVDYLDSFIQATNNSCED